MSDNEYLTQVATAERSRQARARAALQRWIEDARGRGDRAGCCAPTERWRAP